MAENYLMLKPEKNAHGSRDYRALRKSNFFLSILRYQNPEEQRPSIDLKKNATVHCQALMACTSIEGEKTSPTRYVDGFRDKKQM